MGTLGASPIKPRLRDMSPGNSHSRDAGIAPCDFRRSACLFPPLAAAGSGPPDSLPRFALMARFSTILPFPCAFPARQNFSRKNAVHNSTLFDAKMKENPQVPGKTCAGLSHRPQDIVDNLTPKSSQSVDNMHFPRKNPPRKVHENPDFFCYHRDAVPKKLSTGFPVCPHSVESHVEFHRLSTGICG